MIKNDLNFTGTEINYYFTCKSQLWLFAHNITMEHNSDDVIIGKQLHENSYTNEKKEILIDNLINIDFIKNNDILEVHEIKKSNKTMNAHKFQLLYYMYYLNQLKGVEKIIGVLNYPLINKKEYIHLNPKNINEIKVLLKNINQIINNKMPEPKKKKLCKSCSYNDFCWI